MSAEWEISSNKLEFEGNTGTVELSKSHNEKAFGKGIGIVAKIEDEISVGEYAKKVKEAFSFGKCHGIWQSRYKDL